MSARPERLYKYQPVTARTLENLKARKIWFSPPAAFNDPFDCALDIALKQLDDDDLARAMQYIRKRTFMTPEFEAEIAGEGSANEKLRQLLMRGAIGAFSHPDIEESFKRVGVACFSEKNDDLLMWAHYADGHRGFCLEFSTAADPFDKALPVAYRDVVPEVNPLDILDGRTTGPDVVEAMLRTKHVCWQYEREWRLTHAEAGTAYTYDYNALTGLYFGAAMPSGQKDVIGQLLHGSPVQLYAMSRGSGGLAVEASPVTYTPYNPRKKGDGAPSH